jgi:Flp pilus assembly protein TadG
MRFGCMIVPARLPQTTTKETWTRAIIWQERKGTAAVEFAFLLPVFLLMLLGIIEFGRLLWTQSSLQNAVEAAARYAAINYPTCGSTSQTTSYAASETFGQSIPASDFALTCATCGTQVTATLSFTPVVPALLPFLNNITLSAQSCYPT